MPLSPEQEWTLIGCGLVAHADDILEVGEWDRLLRLVEGCLDEDEQEEWLALLTDRGALEKRFDDLAPPDAGFHEELLRQCWGMALADGHGSEVESAVHDRIADKLGVAPDRADELRTAWTQKAFKRAELVVAFAAAMANLDGRMDNEEAVQFDALIERLPLPVNRRLDLSAMLYQPPSMDTLAEQLALAEPTEREAVLEDIVPVIRASSRGERERDAFLDLADRAGVARERALALLAS